jgi:hypothetical protein
MPWPARAVVWLAAAVCLLFASTLSDVSLRALWLPQNLAPALPSDLERSATLRVAVTQDDGVPSDGALVRVFSIVGDQVFVVGGARTGPDGVAVIDRLVPGETWVVVQKLGRARSSSRLVLEPGERTISLSLAPAESFEVVVVDPMQRPILDVKVSLYSSDPLPFVTRTDKSGLARLDGLPGGPYTVEVEAPGYDGKLIDDLTPADSPLFVRLERLGGLEVIVLEPSGAPAQGATVLVAGSTLWPARSAVTDAAGRVTIAGLPRGFYDVRAERGDFVSDTEVGVMLEQGERKTLTLHLVVGSYVTVKVTDGEGAAAPPIANADVALVEDGISAFPRYGRTDDKGIVRLGPIAGGTATASARADGYVARSAVPVEEGVDEVQIPLVRGGTIVGRVIDDRDYPVEGATIEVVGVDLHGMPIVDSSALNAFRDDHFAFALPGATPLIPAGELGVMPIVPDIPRGYGNTPVVSRSERTVDSWMSARDGTFRINPVTPGQIRVIARHPSYVEGSTESFELKSGQEIEVTIVLKAGGILEGRVLEHDRTPVAGARIEVSSPTTALGRVTFTADDGTFAFAALPARVIVSVARAEAPEHVVARETFDVPPDERREVEIVLPEPRDPVTVRVVDDRGYSVEDVEIHASSLLSSEVLIKTLFSDSSGEATLYGARGLALRFTTRRHGWAPSVLEVDEAPRIVEIVIVDGISLVGNIESRHGFLEGAEVTLLTPTGARVARAAKEGAFRIDDLAGEAGILIATFAGYVPHEMRVELDKPPGGEVDLGSIELVEGGAVRGVVVDEAGEPVAGARIALGRVPTYLPLGPLPLGVTESDAKGAFVLRDLEPGRAPLEAYKLGYARRVVEVEIRAGDEREGIEIALVEDPQVDDVAKSAAQASLAVTLGESVEGGRRVIVFEHVPLGGEAQRAGILAGDFLVGCNGRPIRTLEQARRCLDGPSGDDVVLELTRAPDLRWRVRVRRERVRR